MSDISTLIDFLEPVSLHQIANDDSFKDGQIGAGISAYEESLPELEEVDLVLLGCNECRGSWQLMQEASPANTIRTAFYQLYHWHYDLRLADIGNIKAGATLQDTYAAIRTVLSELHSMGKTVIIIGGSHDCTLGMYQAYASQQQVLDAVCVDACIDLSLQSLNRSENFLMEMLTGEPNYIRHYNHIGFQSYYVHPGMLETMDKLRFDCYRVGTVKEHIEEMEPVIRNCQLFSFDMTALANAYAPGSSNSPNGLNGEEACTLMRYAGMSASVNSIGIFGYSAGKDKEGLSAKQVSQMLWYVLDGRSRGKKEAPWRERASFNEYHTAFAECETIFLQSKKTGRWWMQLPDEQFIACSYKDYLLASNNEIPERWLRAQERI